MREINEQARREREEMEKARSEQRKMIREAGGLSSPEGSSKMVGASSLGAVLNRRRGEEFSEAAGEMSPLGGSTDESS